MKNKKKLILTMVKWVIIVALFVFLIIPSINPLLSDELKISVENELKNYFGMATDEMSSSPFSVPKLITAFAIILFVYIATEIVCFIIEKICAGKKRSQTVAGLIISIVKTVCAIACVVWVLSVLGVDLVAIFASLGIVSLIIGFGVQSLIEDCVTGIFIIIEGQYNIGDIIVLGDFRGTVKKIGIRTTTIQDDGGNIKIINNSDIRNIQNRSNNVSTAICEVGISYNEDLLRVEKIIEGALEDIYQRNKDILEQAPTYGGVQSLGPSSVVLRIYAKVKESNIFGATRRLNREIKLLFDANNIEIPFNQLVIHQSDK